MGMFQVRVRVANPEDPGRAFEEDFWVDTGATYTFIPAARLEDIGIAPRSERLLQFADGRSESRPFGEAVLEITGHKETGTCPVIFASGASYYLLGVTALEHFGLTADPINKRLKPTLSIIAGVS